MSGGNIGHMGRLWLLLSCALVTACGGGTFIGRGGSSNAAESVADQVGETTGPTVLIEVPVGATLSAMPTENLVLSGGTYRVGIEQLALSQAADCDHGTRKRAVAAGPFVVDLAAGTIEPTPVFTPLLAGQTVCAVELHWAGGAQTVATEMPASIYIDDDSLFVLSSRQDRLVFDTSGLALVGGEFAELAFVFDLAGWFEGVVDADQLASGEPVVITADADAQALKDLETNVDATTIVRLNGTAVTAVAGEGSE